MFNEKEKDISKPKVEAPKVEKKVEDDPQEKILKEAIKETAKVENNVDYYVTCARLNLRSGASDTSDILTTIGSGDKIVVDKNRTIGAWSKVVKPKEGYVMTKFIAPVK